MSDGDESVVVPPAEEEAANGGDNGDAQADRRKSIRLITTKSRAVDFSGVKSEALPSTAQVTDISGSGLHLLFDWSDGTAFPLRPGDGFGFSLKVEKSREVFELLGEVRWVRHEEDGGGIGVGLELRDVDEATSEKLRRELLHMAFGDLESPGRDGSASRKRGKATSSRRRKKGDTEIRKRRKLFLGEILVQQGVLDEDRLKEFLEHEFSGEKLLGRELAEHGLVDEESVARALAEQLRLPFLSLKEDPPDLELAATLAGEVLERLGCVPVREEHGRILVAVSTRPTLQLIEDLKAGLGRRVRLGISTESEVARWRTRVYTSRYWSLVDRGMLDEQQLGKARALARAEGASIESVLASEFRIPKRELVKALGEHFDCATYEFDPYVALPKALRPYVFDRYEQLKAMRAVPVSYGQKQVTVVMADPRDAIARQTVKTIFHDRKVEYLVATPDDVSGAIDRLFGIDPGGASVGEILRELSESHTGGGWGDDFGEDDPGIREDDSAIVKLLNRIIEDAYAKSASDIHIEPSRGRDAVVRYRIDGVLHKAMDFPGRYRNAIISRIKVMSDLDIAEHRKAQSGKIRFKRWGRLDIELRVETFPSAGGVEDAVLRILSASKARALDDIGMSEHNLWQMRKLVAVPYGLILCVGPTGSGKTTTLHSALGFINREDIKILTAEDPVEITQPGLRQVQVNPKAGITFASSLRSFLRADPDVIMIGEMRDRETASTAVEASMTGHLVLSTLHTNSAPETIVRLLELGIDPYSFADALLGVLAQRLVRTLCQWCRVTEQIGAEFLESLRAEYGAEEIFGALGFLPESVLYHPGVRGCEDCHGSGFRGRMAIHELLCVSDRIREQIYHKASANQIRRTAMDEGMRTLKQDGIEKVLLGHTTMEEVRAVCSR
jgi:type II secretory ATPase GspE/PulE/Tfp pilus assembly ATPase PilB-like protein